MRYVGFGLGNSHSSTGFGEAYGYWVPGPLGNYSFSINARKFHQVSSATHPWRRPEGSRFSAVGATLEFSATWTPKVCKIVAFMAILTGLGF